MNEVQPPPLPYTLRAGGRPFAAVRRRLLTTGPALLVVVAVLGGIAGLISGELGPVWFPVAFVAGVMLLIVVIGGPLLALYGRSTITVTEGEVVVHRVRTLRLTRDEVGELIRGYITTIPYHGGDGQLCLTRRDGSRFTTLPLDYWDGDGLARVAAALGVEPRVQADGDDHLRPFHVRHLWATAFGGALVGVVLIVGAIVLYDAVAAHRDSEAAAQELRTWRADVAPRLRGLGGVNALEATTDHTRVDVTYGGGDIPPGPAALVRDLACRGRKPSLRVELRYTDRHDPQAERGRSLASTCERAADPGFVLGGLAAHPLPRSLRYASFELRPLRDFHDRVIGTLLDFSSEPQLSEAETRAAFCSLRRPRGELLLAGSPRPC